MQQTFKKTAQEFTERNLHILFIKQVYSAWRVSNAANNVDNTVEVSQRRHSACFISKAMLEKSLIWQRTKICELRAKKC